MKKNILLGITFLIIFLGIGISINGPSAHAQTGFNYTDYLMDDVVFRASSTMSAADIQTFLQNMGSGLVNVQDREDCTSASHPTYFAQFYSCNTSQLASKIIYDVSQAYGINPQVILATLQKEQSLVTTVNPAASQINFAMGYGCPDNGGCSQTLAGFFTQVDIATWQFRLDYERLTGNNTWWNNTTTYPCSTSTRYYTQPLLVGNNVTFKDDAGNSYASFVLPNAATATLYCYTPHVYPGSSQQQYSGSYWFVYYFNLWFVPYSWSTTGYKVKDASNTTFVDPGQLQPGQTYTAILTALNNGSATWTNSGPTPVTLATANPTSHTSNLCSNTWISCTRPGVLTESSVAPGQTGHFQFTFKAPLTIGSYREYFKPVAEMLSWFNDILPDESLGIQVVSPGTFTWSTTGYKVKDASNTTFVDPGQLQPGQTYTAILTALNNGSATWTNSGPTPVTLATANPTSHTSNLCSNTWISCTRPGVLTESSVAPGQTGHFQFTFKAPLTIGSYREYFKPVAEMLSWFNDILPDESLGIQVVSPGTFTWSTTGYKVKDASNTTFVDPGQLQPGQTYTAILTALNNGSATWTNSGPTPVTLATANPTSHTSNLCSNTWISCTRPGVLTESSVAPGQTGHFQFTFKAPLTIGSYREYFKPVAEMLSWFNDILPDESLGIVVK